MWAQRYIEVSWIVFVAYLRNMFKMNIIRSVYENLTHSTDSSFAHLVCFIPHWTRFVGGPWVLSDSSWTERWRQ